MTVELQPPDDGGLVVRHADLSLARPPRWAWIYRILIGYLNLLIGNEESVRGC
jgi:hypothetical protein